MLSALSCSVSFAFAQAAGDGKGCSFCGGLGHRISDCPRLANRNDEQIRGANRKDYFGSGGYGGEM